MLPGFGVHLLSFSAVILNAIVAMVPKISGGIKGGYNPATSIPHTDFFTLLQANSG